LADPLSPSPDLPALVAKAQRGDRVAFERLVQTTARLVYAHVVTAVRDRHKAEDLTQEAFLAAWKALPALRAENGGAIIGWLLTLARSKVLDAAKAGARIKRGGGGGGEAAVAARIVPAEEVADGRPLPGESAELRESRERAIAVLEELPEDYRRVLAMRYLAGADYETIRGALGLSDGALRGLLTRGMALMRERMSRVNEDEVPR
jgi:RNA polymerase sigma-70 factor (ECF subfamily)